MSNRVNPQKLAQIRARQEFQRRLDAFNAEEKLRSKKARQLTYEIFILPVVVGVLIAIALPAQPIVAWMSLVFGGLVEYVLIYSWMVNRRPRQAPEPPAGGLTEQPA